MSDLEDEDSDDFFKVDVGHVKRMKKRKKQRDKVM